MGAHAPSGGGGTQTFLPVSVPLTNADIIALADSSIPILSPPANKFINFIHGIIVIDASAVAYGNVDAAAEMFMKVGGQISTVQIDTIAPLLGGDGAAVWIAFTPGTGTYGEAGGSQDLTLFCFNNSAGPFNGGDSANSGYVKVWYSLEDLPS